MPKPHVPPPPGRKEGRKQATEGVGGGEGRRGVVQPSCPPTHPQAQRERVPREPPTRPPPTHLRGTPHSPSQPRGCCPHEVPWGSGSDPEPRVPPAGLARLARYSSPRPIPGPRKTSSHQEPAQRVSRGPPGGQPGLAPGHRAGAPRSPSPPQRLRAPRTHPRPGDQHRPP